MCFSSLTHVVFTHPVLNAQLCGISLSILGLQVCLCLRTLSGGRKGIPTILVFTVRWFPVVKFIGRCPGLSLSPPLLHSTSGNPCTSRIWLFVNLLFVFLLYFVFVLGSSGLKYTLFSEPLVLDTQLYWTLLFFLVFLPSTSVEGETRPWGRPRVFRIVIEEVLDETSFNLLTERTTFVSLVGPRWVFRLVFGQRNIWRLEQITDYYCLWVCRDSGGILT